MTNLIAMRCVLASMALNLSYLNSLRLETLRGEFYYSRVFFIWGVIFSLFCVFGQNIASFRAASFLQLFPGPLGMSPVVFYALVLLIIANTAFQRLLSRDPRRA